MKRISKLVILLATVLLLTVITGVAQATVIPTDAVVLHRICNDSFASILTVNNSYPGLITLDDQDHVTVERCAGWAADFDVLPVVDALMVGVDLVDDDLALRGTGKDRGEDSGAEERLGHGRSPVGDGWRRSSRELRAAGRRRTEPRCGPGSGDPQPTGRLLSRNRKLPSRADS